MPAPQTLDIPVRGMDCASCARHVREAIDRVPGVQGVEVLLAAEKAIVAVDPARPADPAAIRRAIADAGYEAPVESETPADDGSAFGRRIYRVLALVFAVVLFVAVVGEWMGLFEAVTDLVPLPVGVGIVLLLGWPVFRQVVEATLRRQVVAHTLMAVGAVAALVVGEWITAAVVVLFMRVGDAVERFTAERARRSVRTLAALAPDTARVVRDGAETIVPAGQVRPGETVVVRPGERIPVDGVVLDGRATIDQAAITGESMPVDAAPGTTVYAASLARLGALRVRADGVGPSTTFGRVVRLVEEAEANRGPIQRVADRFSALYLPVVAAVAVGTFVFRQDVMATVAVLVVACSCAFALATPVALLASIGAAARRGILIKGGRYLEALGRADVVLLDKTGTLTQGRPRLTGVVPLDGWPEDALLRMAAGAERFSEHPLAEALREAAVARGLDVADPDDFTALPGRGVRARVEGHDVFVGRTDDVPDAARPLAEAGQTLLRVEIDGRPAAVLGVADTLRPEVPAAIDALRALGVEHIEILTGDHERAAAPLADALGLRSRAGLLPDEKIEIVRRYQSEGRTVVMIGDGVNDAPALAQADVGIAMGAMGADVAIEAAHVALLRDDWRLVPDLFRITRRTMGVVRLNIGFTAVYNLAGLTLAAAGLLPPILAAAAQSLPDLGILANSARLLSTSEEKAATAGRGATPAGAATRTSLS